MRLGRILKPERAAPYSQLAYIYDFVMRHVDYANWAAYLFRVFQKARVPVKEVLDISCGTGSLLLALREYDFRLAGLDASSHMLRVAQRRLRSHGLDIPLWQARMNAFAVAKPIQAVVCTYDSINYCLSIEEVKQTLINVSEVLRPGGVFVFDICTLANSTKNFRHYYETDATEEFSYVRKSYFQSRLKIQVNKFLIRRHGSAFLEIHKQRIYRIEEIRAVIPEKRFDLVGIYDGFSFREGSEKSTRVHFCLRKVGA